MAAPFGRQEKRARAVASAVPHGSCGSSAAASTARRRAEPIIIAERGAERGKKKKRRFAFRQTS